jgi:hypothetical protein
MYFNLKELFEKNKGKVYRNSAKSYLEEGSIPENFVFIELKSCQSNPLKIK